MTANNFFVEFYSGWDRGNREIIRQAMCHFDQPEQLPPGLFASRLAQGFRQAMDEIDTVQSRFAWLNEMDISGVEERILALLPADTPIDSSIHITVDDFNNAFVFKNGMGVSVLKGMNDRKTFEDVVSHELHHVCFRYWGARDGIRQEIIQEHSGRSVAVLHVENLLMEGLANYYCTPEYVFRISLDEPAGDPFQTRLVRLQREETQFFKQAEKILALSLESDAVYEACWEEFKTIAFDLEDAMLPAGHYLGARMIQTMQTLYSRDRILACIQHLDEFLPLYNEAAFQTGSYTFDPELVQKFGHLWAGIGPADSQYL